MVQTQSLRQTSKPRHAFPKNVIAKAIWRMHYTAGGVSSLLYRPQSPHLNYARLDYEDIFRVNLAMTMGWLGCVVEMRHGLDIL